LANENFSFKYNEEAFKKLNEEYKKLFSTSENDEKQFKAEMKNLTTKFSAVELAKKDLRKNVKDKELVA